ncbi:MAG: DUF2335 domain-containing protein [Mesorhizobium sp.]
MSKKPTKVPQATAASNKPESQSTASQVERVDEVLTAEIDRQIGTIVPQGQRQQIVARVSRIVQSEKFSGPIAHPRHLREYDAVVPGSADRIIKMAESALAHRERMDTKIVDAEIADRKLGMWLGFAALLIILALAAYFGVHGDSIVAGLFLTTAVLGAIPVFVLGRYWQQKEADEE